MNQFHTEQEEFWASSFGNEYTKRNTGLELIAHNAAFFINIMKHTQNIKTVLEFGSNIGLNLKAIKQIIPQASLSAIEINLEAVAELKKWANDEVHIYPLSIFDFQPDFQRDFVFTKGVLIHIHPDKLQRVYEILYQSSLRYICLAEYYNPSPVTINYRGFENKLFKRDFAGEILDTFPDTRLVDYGFTYHRDNYFPQDDISWFLLEKT